tara:strand:- start:616 stop:900 length:285 start_codon:yes stop_codon:yes gene_type:complete
MSKTKGYVMGLEDKLSQSESDIRAARRKLRGLGVEVMKTHMPDPSIDEDMLTNLDERIKDAKLILDGLNSLVTTAEEMVKEFAEENVVEKTTKP